MSENTEKKEVKKQTDLDLLNKMKALPEGVKFSVSMVKNLL